MSSERFAVLENEIARERLISANLAKDNEILLRREEENKGLLREKATLEKELHHASSYISGLESKLYEANCTSLSLLT